LQSCSSNGNNFSERLAARASIERAIQEPCKTIKNASSRGTLCLLVITCFSAQGCAFSIFVLQILNHTDDRLLVIAGPCSIDDPKAAVEYAHKLLGLQHEVSKDLFLGDATKIYSFLFDGFTL
jgi:hypothetical protein